MSALRFQSRRLSLLHLVVPGLLCPALACRTVPDYGRPLPPGAPALLPLGPDEEPPSFAAQWYERDEIMPALEHSIAWTRKDYARQFFPIEGITRERALASLERFRDLLVESSDAEEFERGVAEEFTVYKSAGWNGRGGGVLFTGYCTPILDGRLRPDAVYCHPLYGLPPDLVKAPDGAILGQQTDSGLQPYPTRRVIEATAMLEDRDLELAWLKDPIDAFIAHVNGSAFIRLEDGELLRLGYAGKNGRPYTSLGQELVKDKQIPKDALNLASIRHWARSNPSQVQGYLDRNDSYVFFTRIDGNPRGSLNVPVTAERSLATDKSLFPRGAIVFVDTRLSSARSGVDLHQFMLDQDTGGAIRTAGRADVYLGVGPEAEAAAGATRAEGQLYYLFLKE
jgi:membrane-bound lytic murein transglycosylase A